MTDTVREGGAERAAAVRPVRPFLSLLVASGGFVIVLDSFAAAVAFPRIEEAFASTPRSTLAWLSSGYSIALAALLLVAGKLGDSYGRRRVFLVGMAGFMLGALASAAAPSPVILITARVLQGCFGAMMVSTSIALAIQEYPPERRGVAMGWVGVMGSIASLVGPVAAGSILEYGGSWRWAFLVSVPVGAAVLLAGPRVLREIRPAEHVEPIDLVGVVLVTASSGLLTYGIIQSGAWGWGSGRTLGVLVAAVTLGVAFVVRCRTAAAPLLSFELFHQRPFLVATVSQLGSQMSIFALFFWLPLFLTNVWDWSPSGVGWVVAIPLVISMISLPVGRFADRHGYRMPLVVGGFVGAAAMAWFAFAAGSTSDFGGALVPGLALFGVGIGLIGITAAAAALAGLEAQELATANAVFQASRRIVQTLGVAVVVAILGDRTNESLAAFRRVWWVCAVGFVASSLVALWYPSTRRAPATRPGGRASDGSVPVR
ncbi:MAG: MFS transporter [Acidimicrobiia bacterium]|nr:MFS transporter [Acidimicrobiia bacterium]